MKSSASRVIKDAVKRLPGIRTVIQERDQLRSIVAQLWMRPGHFYSPIPSLEDIRQHESKIFDTPKPQIAGINLEESEQLLMFDKLSAYYPDLPFRDERVPGLRYFFANPAYSYSDAILLYCMIRHLRPKKIIEVGSGYSSCVMLDTNELNFSNAISTIFIEPFPQLLHSLIHKEDEKRIEIIPRRLQEVDLAHFDMLRANDILFIDSTHVSKTHSDVNRIFFEILPRLATGVYIHIHDIFYPFEYPREWIYEGRAWNEIYALRAFLQYNSSFRIVLMNTFLQHFHEATFRDRMPLCLLNTGGSIWLRKE